MAKRGKGGSVRKCSGVGWVDGLGRVEERARARSMADKLGGSATGGGQASRLTLMYDQRTGGGRRVRFAFCMFGPLIRPRLATWLRDICQCPKCVHPSTRQKLRRSSDALGASIAAHSSTADGLHVTWHDGHASFYPKSFLDRYAASDHIQHLQPWTRLSIQRTPSLFVTYSSLSTTRGLVAAMEQISTHGILFVTDVPNAETSDEQCELRTLAELFGYIRPTFYGPVWDVINVRNSKNIAYTNLHLDLHMDLLSVHPDTLATQFLYWLIQVLPPSSAVSDPPLSAEQGLGRDVHLCGCLPRGRDPPQRLSFAL